MRILIVDDENIVLDSCQRVLESEDFQVSLVSSAEEALEAVEAELPSILLIDNKMPKHDGMYLLREIKKKWPDIPVIVMSGYDTREAIEEALRLGAIDFVPKPFTPDELLEAIHQVTGKEKING